MTFRLCSALLLWLSACATSTPSQKAQLAPVGSFVGPKPVTVPAPIGLTPPAPLVVVPDGEPAPSPKSSSEKEPAPALTSEHRPECTPRRVPHLGGDDLHDTCADRVPRNDARGFDVLVNGKRFDALQLDGRVLWEVKTDNFNTYSDYFQRTVTGRQVLELRRERELARACGFDFRVGVRNAAHKVALELADPELEGIIIVMDWC